ncbi:WD domain containing protein [Brugia malayi]|uniref:BMA-UFD-3 n=3 Tax=Brugia TaxID=6278 RepID=A0A0H5SJX3_BRUMA|nr:WD domain containing protein [Brugia malayi]CRZ24106.1 BMA-UFD-3 [Brugia malayi]VIO94008.1 WD domain containing protein [Brugia malayi]
MEIREESGKKYEFSGIIAAHCSDVKCIVATDLGQIISSSRDECVKVFSERNNGYVEDISFANGERLAVNAVTFYLCPKYGWLIFAGRKDGSIAVYRSDNDKPTRILHEHKMNVCTLHVDAENGKLMSGSWDNNAIIWPIHEIVSSSDFNALCLVGHRLSVWAVASIPERSDFYLTGSADLTIKFWKGDNEINTFSGHEDVVRSLAVLSKHRFLSAANDFTIRLWDIDSGACLQRYSSLSGEYIYSLAHANISGHNLLANSGEGGFLEIWDVSDDGSLTHKQLIRTPAQSLWSLTFLKNNDIAVGADDGNIYIFSAVANRKASAIAMESFQAAVAKKISEVEAILAAQQNEIVKIKVALDDGEPHIELRYKKGSDPYDAAQTFLMENNLPASYLNEVAQYIIENIPEARQATNRKIAQSQSAEKVIMDGKEWDYVFDVTTEDGQILKLPYNVGDDTNLTAQHFIEKHNLPIKFLEKISTLLRLQVPGALGSTSSAGFGNFSDPFTEGRYVPAETENRQTSNGVGFATDPFTGGSAYISNSSSMMPNDRLPIDKKRPRSELVPLSSFFQFGIEQASTKAIVKLRELNEMQTKYKLSEEQLCALEDILKTSTYDPRDIHVSAIDTGFGWNMDTIIPVMDIFRLALLNRTLNRIYCSLDMEGEKSARGLETIQRLTNFLVSASSDPIRILACRAMANSAMHQWGRTMLIHDVNTTLKYVAAQLSSAKHALQLAAATALANWALILLRHTESGKIAELGPREDALRAIIQAIGNVVSFGDFNQIALIRLLQAIVTLMWGDVAIIQLAKGRDIIGIVNRIKDAVVDESGKAVARDIIEMAYSL